MAMLNYVLVLHFGNWFLFATVFLSFNVMELMKGGKIFSGKKVYLLLIATSLMVTKLLWWF
jgi:hypothetical protein